MRRRQMQCGVRRRGTHGWRTVHGGIWNLASPTSTKAGHHGEFDGSRDIDDIQIKPGSSYIWIDRCSLDDYDDGLLTSSARGDVVIFLLGLQSSDAHGRGLVCE